MRVEASNNDISVKAIAGTEVILFGINIPDDKAEGLQGFMIEKKIGNEWRLLNDGRKFETLDVSLVQAFMWSDYSVDKEQDYEYRFAAAYGIVEDLEFTEQLTINVSTENPVDGQNGIFFNRGVAGSQAYSKKFGKYMRSYREINYGVVVFNHYIKPEDVPNREAYIWLSRGLEEALLAFLNQATDSSYTIRASIYELSNDAAAQAFVDALERGVDVKIIHHDKQEANYSVDYNKAARTTVSYPQDEDGNSIDNPDDRKDDVQFDNYETSKYRDSDPISKTAWNTMYSRGIKDLNNENAFEEILIPRQTSKISHNKFIILLKDDKPIEVWTGSTNLTDGGIFGQSNVGQILRDEDIAAEYFNYWTQLSVDPKSSTIKRWVNENNPNLPDYLPENSTHVIFSPREDEGMMEWYAKKIKEAKNSVFFTAAFSIDERFSDVFKNTSDAAENESFLRYILLESNTAQYIKPKMEDMTSCPQNRVAWGDTFDDRPGVENNDELIESLTGLNTHVNFLHTKYMILDALTDDPILVSGSANFSTASTTGNDENMLIIRGNTRLADIYVTEFMRLFNHFKVRNELNDKDLTDEEYEKGLSLDSTSSWKDKYFSEGTEYYNERLLFSKEAN